MLARAGGQARAIDGRMVTAAAREGDEAALESFRIVGTWLGRGIADLAAILDPGVFVIAGGVSQAGDVLRKPAWQAYRSRLTGRGHRPMADLRIAHLGGDEGGVIGAADLAGQPSGLRSRGVWGAFAVSKYRRQGVDAPEAVTCMTAAVMLLPSRHEYRHAD